MTETLSLSAFLARLLEWVTTNGMKLLIGLAILYIGWKVVDKVKEKINQVLTKKGVDKTICSFLYSLIGIGMKVILVIMVMGYVGMDTSALAALVASAGLAVGLALQGSLSNFAGGFIILLMRPFKVGDYIDAAGYSGTVERIQIFYTHLATVDNKEIMIPNGPLSNGSVVNYSSKALRRVDLIFGVGYEASISHVRSVLQEITDQHELIINEPATFVGVNAHGANSVDFVVRAWVKNSDYWTVYFDLLEQVKERFDQEGINIPYPQMDLHVKAMPNK